MSARAATPNVEAGRLPPTFSLREMDCLSRLVEGLTDRAIARDLGIAHPTVRLHLESARRKVGARSRTHLAALVVALGVASPSTPRPSADV